MTEQNAPDLYMASEAALEVMESTTLLMVNLAAVTRLPEAGQAVQTLIGCRLVELLEIYIRRVLELIFNHDPKAWSGRTKIKLSMAEAQRMEHDEVFRNKLLQAAREEDAAQIAGRFDETSVPDSFCRG
ncbi:hypothetical protein [Deinococcus aquaedulcis]|uniref:hypothetical protein n=1 Tax=Deinococcus aquaedulcis TaxID=2840455 RepID=UPI001C840844|nr:hypothetical protein [Deinococcus aquaedulcis]